jgi:hypothetical protein
MPSSGKRRRTTPLLQPSAGVSYPLGMPSAWSHGITRPGSDSPATGITRPGSDSPAPAMIPPPPPAPRRRATVPEATAASCYRMHLGRSTPMPKATAASCYRKYLARSMPMPKATAESCYKNLATRSMPMESPKPLSQLVSEALSGLSSFVESPATPSPLAAAAASSSSAGPMPPTPPAIAAAATFRPWPKSLIIKHRRRWVEVDEEE